VILATAPQAAADLLEPLAPGPAGTLRSIKLMSNVSVSLAYVRPAVQHPLNASGFVVPPDDPSTEGLRACAFCSSKFPNRAPDGHVLLRAFFRPEGVAVESVASWEAGAARVLSNVLGISADPIRTWAAAWPSALPSYTRDHASRMKQMTVELEQIGGIALAGSAYDQGGVPGAVRSGRSVARRVLETLSL
jgi:oxygen-dependent protoporphyrinogen oxidase